ncbi:hypothetical protein SDC9_103596 [bioreactor metagenome]|uniref:Minor capsid protein n=1 Tax=bioreactor metagenome TaxID=1076179 RepID=A0A645AWU4_9ZZZZ|nr:minor capsid protein [Oscillospiraceae bacterium]
MSKGFTVTANIDIPVHLKRIHNDAFWKFAANEWKRLYTPWVPYRTGTLSQQTTITPGEISHTVPYAYKTYNGIGMHFRKNKHPLASAEWDKAAEPSQKGKLIDAMQNYVDSGRLKL